MTQGIDDEQAQDALKYFFVASSNLLTVGLRQLPCEERQKIMHLVYQGRGKIEIRYSGLRDRNTKTANTAYLRA